ncbi:MAG: endonuclease [Bacteroidales bacterium]|jgi:endonuclease I|nr:endonuclease [Bacteroidales bacterium]
MNKKLLLSLTFGIITSAVSVFAAGSNNYSDSAYYHSALNKSGYELKTALHDIIKTHKRLAYGKADEVGDNVWYRYRITDQNPDGSVRDIYTTPGTYHFGHYGEDSAYSGYQCGNAGNDEGGACSSKKSCRYCYSREHSFPKSWWDDQGENNTTDSMYTDVNHLIPADQYINSAYHSNYPLGEVDSASAKKTSILGYRYGPNKLAGYSGTVFEPADKYKGYFARMYFYMVTRYESKVAGWIYKYDTNQITNPSGTQTTKDIAKRDTNRPNLETTPTLNGTSDQCFTDWTKDMLVRWHNEHPVQDWERARNDSVYKVQGNRNPFTDHPELVNKIWGNDDTPFGETPSLSRYSIKYIYKKNDSIIEEKLISIPEKAK